MDGGILMLNGDEAARHQKTVNHGGLKGSPFLGRYEQPQKGIAIVGLELGALIAVSAILDGQGMNIKGVLKPQKIGVGGSQTAHPSDCLVGLKQCEEFVVLYFLRWLAGFWQCEDTEH